MNTKRIIELFQQREELTQLRASFATTDTIKIGDDPKKLVELPIRGVVETVSAVIAEETQRIDQELAALGVRLI